MDGYRRGCRAANPRRSSIQFAIRVSIGSVRIISTHFGDDNPFNELIQECRAGKSSAYWVNRIIRRVTAKTIIFQTGQYM